MGVQVCVQLQLRSGEQGDSDWAHPPTESRPGPLPACPAENNSIRHTSFFFFFLSSFCFCFCLRQCLFAFLWGRPCLPSAHRSTYTPLAPPAGPSGYTVRESLACLSVWLPARSNQNNIARERSRSKVRPAGRSVSTPPETTRLVDGASYGGAGAPIASTY
ncbi:uncharacterized protein J3D65DRAFT_391530 [Phyllosticta citribraziliensis]|uniref:Uncharacterized protein n=1 Tax=Phyllosticta citribraziliensis TaxID=989973 RepID=A0ABR1LKV4_9PEZI